jgi:hypothetical protein
MIHEYGEQRWNDIDREDRACREKTCPGANFSTTNPTLFDPAGNPGFSDNPATNRLVMARSNKDEVNEHLRTLHNRNYVT